MGKELEYKLLIPNEETLTRILADEELSALAMGAYAQTQMKTTYYDTPDRRFATHYFTLRQRFEGDRSIVCLKTPLKESHARGEWQIPAETIDDAAVERLVELGAPKELLVFYGVGNILPVCGAQFLRQHVMLQFSDGSQAELAGDHGFLYGQQERLPFTELELELYRGDPHEMLALVKRLCDKFSLREQPKSKYARARALK